MAFPNAIDLVHVTMRSMQETFGELIRNRREALGIKSFELAQKLKRQPSLISRIETGAYKETPPPEVLAGLSEELGLSQWRMLRSLGYMDKESNAPSDTIEMLDPLDQDLIRVLPRLEDQQKVALLSYAEFLGGSNGAKALSAEHQKVGETVPLDGGKRREADLVRRSG